MSTTAPALNFPYDAPPEPGFATKVCEGVHWIRMPLPFALDHINLWLIEEGEGWALVDTGFGGLTNDEGSPTALAALVAITAAAVGGGLLRRRRSQG